jgi:hypothetical protein
MMKTITETRRYNLERTVQNTTIQIDKSITLNNKIQYIVNVKQKNKHVSAEAPTTSGWYALGLIVHEQRHYSQWGSHM